MANSEYENNKSQITIHDEEFKKLKALVMQHKVCWEVWPEYLIDKDGKKLQIGFELDLMGIHYHPENHPTPGCKECVNVYNDLKKIAMWIMPKEERDSRYDIGIFDRSIHSAPIRKLRDDVTLTLKILHREGFDRPIDSCEVDCLKEMEEKLKEMGAQKERWQKLSNEFES